MRSSHLVDRKKTRQYDILLFPNVLQQHNKYTKAVLHSTWKIQYALSCSKLTVSQKRRIQLIRSVRSVDPDRSIPRSLPLNSSTNLYEFSISPIPTNLALQLFVCFILNPNSDQILLYNYPSANCSAHPQPTKTPQC